MSGTMLSHLIETIRASAVAGKGFCTFPFSQAVGPAAAVLTAAGQPDGICQALVNRWIVAHARGDSLWNELYPGGALDDGQLRLMVAEQTRGSRALPDSRHDKLAIGGYLAQSRFNEAWLARHGVRLWQSAQIKASGGFGAFPNAMVATKQLNEVIANCQPSDGAYLNIALQRTTNTDGGHAICVHIGPYTREGTREIVLFDPNFGEFYFPDRAAFRTWFGFGFMKPLAMSRDYGFKAFTAIGFAPAARAIAGPLPSRGRSRAVFGRH